MSRKQSKAWDTFLRIQDPQTTDVVPPLSDEWMTAYGVYPGAPAVISCLRDKVLPVIRDLRDVLDWYFFLIHDRTSGVPTDDKGEYVHLRLVFREPIAKLGLPTGWEMTRSVDFKNAGGFNFDIMCGDNPAVDGMKLLAMQSEWVLSFLEAHRADAEPMSLIKQIRQFFHFTSNMLQVKGVG